MVMTTKERLQKKLKDRGIDDKNILTELGMNNVVEIVIEEKKIFKEKYPKTVIELCILEESYEYAFRIYICIRVLKLIEKLQTNHYKELFIKNLPNEVIDVACSYYLQCCFDYYKMMTEQGISFDTVILENDIFNEDDIMKKMKKQQQF